VKQDKLSENAETILYLITVVCRSKS